MRHKHLVASASKCYDQPMSKPSPTPPAKPVPIRIPPEMVARIDALKDPLIPREAYVRHLLDAGDHGRGAEGGKAETVTTMSAQQGNIYETRTATASAGARATSAASSPGSARRPRRGSGSASSVAPRLNRGAPSAEITLRRRSASCSCTRHTGAPRTVATLRDRLTPARATFGDWKLSELEHAADRHRRLARDDAGGQPLPADQRAAASVRRRGPLAVHHPQPGRRHGPEPAAARRGDRAVHRRAGRHDRHRTRARLRAVRRVRRRDRIADERMDRARTPRCRPRWCRHRPAPVLARTADALSEDGPLAPPRSRSPPAHSLRSRCSRQGSTRRSLFPAAQGGHIGLDTWRTREWYPALDAAGISRRGPYCLRHTFATEAFAAGISTFELSRLMGSSIEMIERTYGHLARDSERRSGRAWRRDPVRWAWMWASESGLTTPPSYPNPPSLQAIPAKRTTGLEPATFGLGSRRSTN